MTLVQSISRAVVPFAVLSAIACSKSIRNQADPMPDTGSDGSSSDGAVGTGGAGAAGGETGGTAGKGGSAGEDAGNDASAGQGGVADASEDAALACDAPRTFYRDVDGDGHGDPAVTTVACDPPPEFVENDTDCYDGNEDARPGQVQYFAEHRGDGSFDYDCNDEPRPQWTAAGNCAVLCTMLVQGWNGPTPACGTEGQWINSCALLSGMLCNMGTEPRVQACR